MKHGTAEQLMLTHHCEQPLSHIVQVNTWCINGKILIIAALTSMNQSTLITAIILRYVSFTSRLLFLHCQLSTGSIDGAPHVCCNFAKLQTISRILYLCYLFFHLFLLPSPSSCLCFSLCVPPLLPILQLFPLQLPADSWITMYQCSARNWLPDKIMFCLILGYCSVMRANSIWHWEQEKRKPGVTGDKGDRRFTFPYVRMYTAIWMWTSCICAHLYAVHLWKCDDRK